MSNNEVQIYLKRHLYFRLCMLTMYFRFALSFPKCTLYFYKHLPKGKHKNENRRNHFKQDTQNDEEREEYAIERFLFSVIQDSNIVSYKSLRQMHLQREYKLGKNFFLNIIFLILLSDHSEMSIFLKKKKISLKSH